MPAWLRRVIGVVIQVAAAVALAVGTTALLCNLGGVTGASWLFVAVGSVAGLNALVAALMGVYAWSSVIGWLAFFLDHSWAIVGTAIALLLHFVNLFWLGGRQYNDSLSRGSNRFVYDGGFGFSDFAFTQGLVTSNLQMHHGNLVDHETLHVWQSRLFGPVFQLTYITWFVVGAIVGTVVSIFAKQSWYQTVVDIAYLDNPWETWAYKVGGTPRGGRFSWA
jgi:hypothetical protein